MYIYYASHFREKEINKTIILKLSSHYERITHTLPIAPVDTQAISKVHNAEATIESYKSFLHLWSKTFKDI